MSIIDKYLSFIEPELKQVPFKSHPAGLYDSCRYILDNGGKRLRPVLTMIGTGLCGGEPVKALPAALSIELIHNFTLVHDDIMDEADSRRGQPSVHIRWDLPTAILAGDLLYTEAFKQLMVYEKPEFETIQSRRLWQILLSSIQSVCEGQAMDLDMKGAKTVSTDQYLKMIEGKTSALISGALMMGGVIASADEERIRSLSLLGTTIGLAFQIQDDLLDVTADPAKFGKIKGGDILEGKKTCLFLLALERCNETLKNELHTLMRLRQMSPADIERVITIFREAGAIRQAELKVQTYYKKASDILNSFDDSVYKEDLVNLLNFLKNRDF